jgi:hypothetical protein
LRASLVSATSLLALLLLECHEAVASPIVKSADTSLFNYALGSTWDAGTDDAASTTSADTYLFTPLTTGAVSTAGLYNGPNPYLVGQSALMTLAANHSVDTVRRPAGPRGSDSVGDSVFVGTSGNAFLLDSPTDVASTASASYGYTFTPKTDATAKDLVPTDSNQDQIKFDVSPAATPVPSPRLPSGEPRQTPGGGIPSVPIASTGVGRNPAGTVPAATGGRTFAIPVQGMSVFKSDSAATTRLAVSGSSRTSPNAYRDEAIRAFNQIVRNVPAGTGNDSNNLANLTARGYANGVADASTFTVSSTAPGSATTGSVIVPVPVKIVATSAGELSSSLLIFLDEAAAPGAGYSFSFYFERAILR